MVVGNPKPQSRTLRVASAVATALSASGELSIGLVADLADVAPELFDPRSERVQRLLEAVAASQVIVVASPTYKATYTGLLKSFLDRYHGDALAGCVGVPVMTGAAPTHALAPEVHLRPLLVELGATVPSRALFVTEDEMEDLDAVIAPWVNEAMPLVQRALSND